MEIFYDNNEKKGGVAWTHALKNSILGERLLLG